MTEREIKIRIAVEKDIAQIVELNYALFQEDAGQRDPYTNLNWPREEGEDHFSRLVSGQRSICLLAEIEGDIVGYLVGYVSGADSLRPVELAELESMFIKAGYRGQQVGTNLVSRFIEWARENRAQRISVTAYPANKTALDFYKAVGFEPKSLTLELGIQS